jgi:membrane protein DedA with SNARE-associated domain
VIALSGSWTDPAAIGYPALFGGVLLGSLVPVVPTGAVVGAAAAIATTTDHLSLPLVVLLAAAGALLGVARAGSDAALRWVARGQTPERLASARRQFATRGWQLVVVGRLVPGGRIPVLLAAGALGYSWRRFVPAATVACLLWAITYAALGIVSGGRFDDPLIATLLAAVLVLVLGGVASLVSARLRRRKARR